LARLGRSCSAASRGAWTCRQRGKQVAPGGHRLFPILSGDDVRLHGGLRGVGRVTGDQAALVERAVAQVGVGGAAVAAAAEDHRALLLHRAPAGGEAALVIGGQAAGGRVAALEGELGRPVVLEDGGDEGDGIHGAGAVGFPVRFTVPVVEAAAAVVVLAARHHVHPFGRAAGGDPGYRRRRPVAVPRGDVERVDLVAAELDRLARRAGGFVLTAGGAARALVLEVVAVACLVVDDGDDARGARAEGVLRGRVGGASGFHGGDVLGRAAGVADLI